MPEYEQMFFRLLLACEQAMNILMEAEEECERMYVRAKDAQRRRAELPAREQEGGIEPPPARRRREKRACVPGGEIRDRSV